MTSVYETPIKTDSLKKSSSYVGKYEHLFNKHYSEDDIKQLADEMFDWFQQTGEKGKPVNIWLKDFAVLKMIGRQRLSEFEKKNEYFAGIFQICKDLQESYLFKLGMSKSVNPGMPVFALKNVAGWRDTFDVGLGLPEQYLELLKQEALNLMQKNL